MKISYLIIFFYLLAPKDNYSQGKYEFDFDTQWSWEDLINSVVVVTPVLIKSVDSLKKGISIIDARIILKKLSQLSSLNDLRQISNLALFDPDKNKLKWDSILNKSFGTIYLEDDFSGLLAAANLLSKIRNANVFDEFEFEDRSYLSQPIEESKKNIDITFDYSCAESVLKYYESRENYADEILNCDSYKFVLNDKSIDEVTKNDFNNYISESSREDSLLSVYKWVNPASFWNLGGVSIYAKNLRTVLLSLKDNERNIKFDINKHISGYLPDSIFFEVDIMFLFGKKNPGWFSGKNRVGINLEYFGDDYYYLVRFIQHQIFILAGKEIQLPVDEYVVESYDTKFVRLLTKIFENGTSNYVAPIGTETRPWNLLEKDFRLFVKTFRNLYKRNNNSATDTLIEFGCKGEAPFYTMATQMAYIIETTLGRNALIESIRCGPVSFFHKYIEAYKEFPEKIRKVFTFNRKLEEKISSLKNLLPSDIIKDALRLKKYRSDTILLNDMITNFLIKYDRREHDKLINLLAGQLFLESNQYEKAAEYFLNGISGKINKGELAGKIGDLFSSSKEMTEALRFYNFYVEVSPKDPLAFERRGEFYYRNGDDEKARNDFEIALVINSKLNIARTYLEKINSK